MYSGTWRKHVTSCRKDLAHPSYLATPPRSSGGAFRVIQLLLRERLQCKHINKAAADSHWNAPEDVINEGKLPVLLQQSTATPPALPPPNPSTTYPQSPHSFPFIIDDSNGSDTDGPDARRAHILRIRGRYDNGKQRILGSLALRRRHRRRWLMALPTRLTAALI